MGLEDIGFQLILLVISFIANFLSALSGGGAGLIQLPALILLGLPFTIALSTHKVASVFLGIGAGIRHYKTRKLRPKFAVFILTLGLPGVIIGSQSILQIPDAISNLILGSLTLMLALFSSNSPDFGSINRHYNNSYSKCIVGGLVIFIIGILNGSFSSGTGLFVTFWLVKWYGLNYSEAVSYTLILVGLFWNATGAVSLGFQEEIHWKWIPALLAGSLLGGYFGAETSIKKGSLFVKRSCEALSLIMGASLISKSFLQFVNHLN